MLAPVLRELHGAAERARGQRDEHLLGPRVVDLDAEAAADVGRDHVDLAEVEAQLDRDCGADAGRGLGRGPHLQPADVGVPAGHGAAALHRHAGAALDREVEAHPVRCGGHGLLDVAGVLLHPRADVAGHVVVHQVVGGAGRLDADDRRQELVLDPDPADRVLGDVAVVGDHERDRLAHVVDLFARQRVLRAAMGQVGVRDQQRQRLGHRCGEVAQVVVGPDGVDALELEHLVDVDVDDPRVGVRRTEHRGVQGAGADRDVVDIAALAADQPLVLDPLHLGAHQLGRHASSPPSTAARSTALTMFW